MATTEAFNKAQVAVDLYCTTQAHPPSLHAPPITQPRNRPVAEALGAVEDAVDAAINNVLLEGLDANVHPDPPNNTHLVWCYKEFTHDWLLPKQVHSNGKNRTHCSPNSQVRKLCVCRFYHFCKIYHFFSSVSMYVPFLFVASLVASIQESVTLLCSGEFLRTPGTNIMLTVWLER
jgi:hypothetical protein